ncbi:MAG: DNA-binding domain-containing protein [Planctomycetota bacterium]
MSARRGSGDEGRKVRGSAPRRGRGSEAAPGRIEGLVFAGHPGGLPRVQASRPRAPLRAGLDAVENWMQAVITDPGGVAAGERSTEARRHIDRGAGTIEQVILPSRQQSSRERLQVYANAYYWRLIDILAEEYPVVRHATGPRRFSRLAVEYLQTHPSRSYSLNFLSIAFPAFLRSGAKQLPRRDFLADVATVERTMEDVFDAPDVKPITPKAWRKIPMSAWMSKRLKMTPAMRLLELGYPVNGYLSDVREGKNVKPPPKEKQRIIIFRRNYSVWRAPLTPIRFKLLSLLQSGSTLPEAFGACAALKGFDAEKFTGALKGWFRGWASDGLFCGVD